MKYQEFLDYIYLRHSGNVKLGLDRMENILKLMENPNKKLQGIHIAGTNGKGSTAAICEALSIESDLKTGLNTSPHLVDYRERIRIDGKNIGLEKLIDIYKKWENIFEENEASFFEITTAMAFYQFYQQQVENAIFEVGLGGRLDGTNPFRSTVSVITTISYDHTKSLGDSLEKIAFEKAGILKNGIPLVLGKMPEEASQIIKKRAEELDIQVFELGKDFKVTNIKISTSGTSFDFQSKDCSQKKLKLNLIGKHQADNAAIAIFSFLIFLKRTNRTFKSEKIRNALTKINWSGRMQIIQKKPTVMIDGAHNEEGIKVLTQNLKELFPNKKIYFVMAILRDKNLGKIIEKIIEVSHKIFISKNRSTRAAEIEEQEKFVKNSNIDFEVIDNVLEATKTAIKQAVKEDIVIISGSLYTISEVLEKQQEL